MKDGEADRTGCVFKTTGQAGRQINAFSERRCKVCSQQTWQVSYLNEGVKMCLSYVFVSVKRCSYEFFCDNKLRRHV